MFFQVNYLDISILFKVTNIYNGIKHTFFSYTLMQWFSLQPYQHLPVFYFDLNYSFYHLIYIYNHMEYIVLIDLIQLFLVSY